MERSPLRFACSLHLGWHEQSARKEHDTKRALSNRRHQTQDRHLHGGAGLGLAGVERVHKVGKGAQHRRALSGRPGPTCSVHGSGTQKQQGGAEQAGQTSIFGDQAGSQARGSRTVPAEHKARHRARQAPVQGCGSAVRQNRAGQAETCTARSGKRCQSAGAGPAAHRLACCAAAL